MKPKFARTRCFSHSRIGASFVIGHSDFVIGKGSLRSGKN
jgi:hypothetical protein